MLWMVSHVHEFVNRVGDGIESVALYCIVFLQKVRMRIMRKRDNNQLKPSFFLIEATMILT